MNVTVIVSVALLSSLVFLLGANVTRLRAVRGPTGDQFPADPSDSLFKAIRAHGNAAEYIPTLMALLIVCATLTDGWWLATLAVISVVVRILHAIGILTSPTLANHGPLRDIGAAGTYAVGIALGVTALTAL
jgi:uncharacterized membrane protein YecN with MAPEG domain